MAAERLDPLYAWETLPLAQRPSVAALDTETTGVEYYDTPFLVTMTWRPHGWGLQSFSLDLENDPIGYNSWKAFLSRNAVKLVGHNLKFDVHMLVQARLLDARDANDYFHEWEDTAVMYHLIDENDRKGLKYLAQKFLADEIPMLEVEKKDPKTKALYTVKVPAEDEELRRARHKLGMKKEDGYHRLPRDLVTRYALKDTEYTLLLAERFHKRLYDLDLLDVYREEMRAVAALYRMERRGFGIDEQKLEQLLSEYGTRVLQLEHDMRKLTDKDFNPGSPTQIIHYLAKRGVMVEDSQASTLRKLDDKLAQLLCEYRDVKKVHATYLQGLKREQRDGVWHPNFNPTGARTGRLSSRTGE